MDCITVKPLFKYIGGKTWLKEKLREKVLFAVKEKNFDSYVEPFAGGLGAFLGVYDILASNNIKNVVLADINVGLINLYNHIKNNHLELHDEIVELESAFSKTIHTPTDKKHTKLELSDANDYFKEVREFFNSEKGQNSIIQSARLVFLQKHAFNGVYRENGKGDYNTPFNWSPNTMEKELLDRLNDLKMVFDLFNIQFENKSYEDHSYQENDLYYLDPPYLNTKEVIENKYNQSGFNISNQMELILKIKNTNFIYSNHDSEILENELKTLESINIERINRKNIMSASSATRANDKLELLATYIKH